MQYFSQYCGAEKHEIMRAISLSHYWLIANLLVFILRVKCLQSSTFDCVALRINNFEFWNFLVVLAWDVYLP